MVNLDQPISTVMRSSVVSVGINDTVHAVEQVMELHDLNSVPVIDPERHDCFGIISLKDIRHFHSRGGFPMVTKAWEMCTYRPLTATVDTTVRQVAQMMIEHCIHHVVVHNLHKRVVGYLSTLDVLSFLLGELQCRRRSDSPM